jgi:hypothetical protein
MKSLKLVFGTAAFFALSACGKVGPYGFELTPSQPFGLVTHAGTVTFEPGQKLQGVAAYHPLSKKLELEIGAGKVTFSGAKASRSQERLISSPANSGIRTTGGDAVGVAAERKLVCAPECERIERRREEQECTYQEWVPVVICQARNGGDSCSTRWDSYLRTGHQIVSIETRSKDYEVQAIFFGATSGPLATARATFTETQTDIRDYSTCL